MMVTLFLILLLVKETYSRIKITFFSHSYPAVAVFMKPMTYILLALYLLIIYGSFVFYCLQVSRVNGAMSLLGGILFFAGVILRNASIRQMGPFWSFHVEIKKDHRLIGEGPYAFLRHPYSVAVLLELAGFSLLANAWPFFFLTLGAQLPLLWYRAMREEKILKEFFQHQYLEYAKARGAFFPKIF